MVSAGALLPYRDEILRLAAHHRASNVRVFGSFARGDAGERSDLDLLVDFDPQSSLYDRIGLKQDLEDLLGRPVDVLSPKTIHHSLRDRVLAEAVPL